MRLRSALDLSSDPGLERRLAGATFGVLLVWLLLFARLFDLQLVHGDAHRVSAARNSVRTHRFLGPRGVILDRHGETLVDSRPSFDVVVIPHEVSELPQTLDRIAELSGENPAELHARVGQPRGRARFQTIRAVRDLDRDALARVEGQLWALRGVLTQVEPARSYAAQDSAAHLLGSLGEVTAEQLESRKLVGYRAGDIVGRAGIEAWLDEDLRGQPGGRNVLVDAHGRELEVLDAIEPQPGNNVRLTLDGRLQRVAEAALDETGHSGAVVALDPGTGEVLVLASRPAPNPNEFALGIPRERWQALVDDARKPLQNRALQGQYPPGSTYKIVTALAALEDGKVAPDTRVHCNGSMRFGRRRYRCWKAEGHGEVDLHRALVESCDVFFYTLGAEVGVDRLAHFARALGLGRRTGIEFFPESPGLVPTAAWKQRRFGEPWIGGETLSIAIGQGFNLWTPIQLAVSFAAVANGGTLFRPYLVERVEDPEGNLLRAWGPEALGRVPASPSSLATIRAALRGVVHDEHGTGWRMRNLAGGLDAGAKTGTAQVVALSEHAGLEDDEIPEAFQDHAWFVTYAPAEQPRILVGVLVEHGGSGSASAAPIARRVVDAFLAGTSSAPGGLHAGHRPPAHPEL